MHHDAFAILDALKSKLDAHRPLAPELVRNLREDMELKYTYHSNAIEGNRLTLKETLLVLREGMTIKGKNGRFNLDPLSLDLYQGTVAARANLDVTTDTPKTDLIVDAEKIERRRNLKN